MYVVKTKGLICCAVTAQLTCAFFSHNYAKSRFSHGVAHSRTYSKHQWTNQGPHFMTIEPRHEKTNVLHMRKQRPRSASR